LGGKLNNPSTDEIEKFKEWANKSPIVAVLLSINEDGEQVDYYGYYFNGLKEIVNWDFLLVY